MTEAYPYGKPLLPPGMTETDMSQMRQMRMAEVLSGKHDGFYSSWLLRGKLGEDFQPSVALAFFPMIAEPPSPIVHIPQVYECLTNHDPATTYWRIVGGLTLPERAVEYEQRVFGVLDPELPVKMAEAILPIMTVNLLPSAMIVFSRTTQDRIPSSAESAYLFCPTDMPPSMSFQRLQMQAQTVMGRISKAM